MIVQYLENLIMWAKKAVGKQFFFSCHYKTVSEETTNRKVVPFFSLSGYKRFQSRPTEKKERLCLRLQAVSS